MNEIMTRQTSQVGEYQESKQLTEVKGKMILARQFPRDINRSLENVLLECQAAPACRGGAVRVPER